MPRKTLIASVLLFFGSASLAQTSSISGRVLEENGVAIRDALVRCLNLSSGKTEATTTGHEGVFAFADLPSARYEILIEKTGFRKLRLINLQLRPGEKWLRDLKLEKPFVEPPLVAEAESIPLQSPALPQELDQSTIKNFFRVNEQICTGGQPTMEELEKLKAQGVRSIINLRRESEFNAEEEAAKAKELGLYYFHIPFSLNEPKDEPVAEFIKRMDEKDHLPVFIHCATANRVAAFWLIRRVQVDGWALEKADEEAKKIGLTNPKLREWALDYLERHKKKAES